MFTYKFLLVINILKTKSKNEKMYASSPEPKMVLNILKIGFLKNNLFKHLHYINIYYIVLNIPIRKHSLKFSNKSVRLICQ